MSQPSNSEQVSSDSSIPVYVIEASELSSFLNTQTSAVRTFIEHSNFTGKLGQALLIPHADGQPLMALAGWGDAAIRARDRLHMALIARQLPKGIYHIESKHSNDELYQIALAWLLEAYRYDRYKHKPKAVATLVAPKEIDTKRLYAIIASDFLTRDLINTPASDMGPIDLEQAFLELANGFNAEYNIISGTNLLDENLPLIHAVGRASAQEPRLLDLKWGDETAPKVTLVGKGVCFDTGGLNIKPGSSMGLMKKDMGGAATVIGIAQMIMALNIPIRLRVLIPAVENSISSNSYRPQDILSSRKGLTVEVNNTDAEGRLVLADALALADEESPDMLICLATLTGAARVALGPDLPPFYTDNEALVTDVFKAANAEQDPIWRMPFWDPYESLLEPSIADLDNAPKGGFAGSIMAALFLRRFVEHADKFIHFDIFGWAPNAKAGRTAGGACQASRAILNFLESHYKSHD